MRVLIQHGNARMGAERKETPSAMQSSTTVVCRALVMLACLVAIPLAALFGTSLPELVKGLVSRWAPNVATVRQSLPEAPQFGQMAHASPTTSIAGGPAAGAWSADASLQPAPQWQPTSVTPQGPVLGASCPVASPSGPIMAATAIDFAAPNAQGVTGPSGPMLASYETEVAPATAYPSGVASNPLPDPFGDEATSPFDLVPVPASNPQLQAVPQAGASPAAYTAGGTAVAAPSASAQAVMQTDRFTYIQDRLRELGATYYLLESWGSDGRLYRFYCKMAIGDNPNYTRYFEATDADALQAMTKVMQDVEAWRAGP